MSDEERACLYAFTMSLLKNKNALLCEQPSGLIFKRCPRCGSKLVGIYRVQVPGFSEVHTLKECVSSKCNYRWVVSR